MRKPVLSVTDLSVAFGGLKALSDVSMTVEEGQVVGVIGPNGSGKTTLLNAISGFVRNGTAARLEIDGRDVRTLRPSRIAHLGLRRTFQHPETARDGTVMEAAIAGAGSGGRSPAWGWALDRGGSAERALSAERIRELLSRLGILEWADRPVGSAPFGVMKRVEIVRALFGAPRLLLLDEPASGMTSSEKNVLAAAISDIPLKDGASVVVIEHDITFLRNVAHAMVALNVGNVVASGSPAHVTSSPSVIDSYLGGGEE